MRRAALAGACLTGTVLACAKVSPPPGGDVDTDPPSVLASLPPPEAAGVAADSTLTLIFSEPPDRRSVLGALHVLPAVDFAASAWSAETLRVTPDPGWARDRPTLVVLARGAKDRRGNAMRQPFRTRFTTQSALGTGAVSGRVWPGKEVPSGEDIVAAAYASAAGDTLDPERDVPVALASTDGGRFRLTGLDATRPHRVAALLDRNGDGRPASRGEFWQEAPSVCVFPDEGPAEVLLQEFLLGTLDSLGTISGDVRADSASPAVVVATSGGEALLRKPLHGGGKFRFELPTGAVYGLTAFLDADGDTARSPGERGIDTEQPVSLELTAERGGILLDLRSGSAALPDTSTAKPPDEETTP